MTRLLEDKIAIVTGAAQGIGRVIAETLADHGGHVVVADIQLEKARAVAEHIASRKDRHAIPVHVDVTDRSSVESMVQTTVAEFGRVDILVNNAGILKPHLIIDFPEEDWDAIFAVNVKGVFLCSQAVAKQMIKQGTGGSIINISSASGKKADREESAYCASKSAVNGFTRCLALELGKYAIRANGICPGATDTEMLRDLCSAIPGLFEELKAKTALGRIAMPKDQANVVVFLASDLAGHITGESIIVSGGELMGQ